MEESGDEGWIRFPLLADLQICGDQDQDSYVRLPPPQDGIITEEEDKEAVKEKEAVTVREESAGLSRSPLCQECGSKELFRDQDDRLAHALQHIRLQGASLHDPQGLGCALSRCFPLLESRVVRSLLRPPLLRAKKRRHPRHPRQLRWDEDQEFRPSPTEEHSEEDEGVEDVGDEDVGETGSRDSSEEEEEEVETTPTGSELESSEEEGLEEEARTFLYRPERERRPRQRFEIEEEGLEEEARTFLYRPERERRPRQRFEIEVSFYLCSVPTGSELESSEEEGLEEEARTFLYRPERERRPRQRFEIEVSFDLCSVPTESELESSEEEGLEEEARTFLYRPERERRPRQRFEIEVSFYLCSVPTGSELESSEEEGLEEEARTFLYRPERERRPRQRFEIEERAVKTPTIHSTLVQNAIAVEGEKSAKPANYQAVMGKLMGFIKKRLTDKCNLCHMKKKPLEKAFAGHVWQFHVRRKVYKCPHPDCDFGDFVTSMNVVSHIKRAHKEMVGTPVIDEREKYFPIFKELYNLAFNPLLEETETEGPSSASVDISRLLPEREEENMGTPLITVQPRMGAELRFTADGTPVFDTASPVPDTDLMPSSSGLFPIASAPDLLPSQAVLGMEVERGGGSGFRPPSSTGSNDSVPFPTGNAKAMDRALHKSGSVYSATGKLRKGRTQRCQRCGLLEVGSKVRHVWKRHIPAPWGLKCPFCPETVPSPCDHDDLVIRKHILEKHGASVEPLKNANGQYEQKAMELVDICFPFYANIAVQNPNLVPPPQPTSKHASSTAPSSASPTTCRDCGEIKEPDANAHILAWHMEGVAAVSCPLATCRLFHPYDVSAVKTHIQKMHPEMGDALPVDKRGALAGRVAALRERLFQAPVPKKTATGPSGDRRLSTTDSGICYFCGLVQSRPWQIRHFNTHHAGIRKKFLDFRPARSDGKPRYVACLLCKDKVQEARKGLHCLRQHTGILEKEGGASWECPWEGCTFNADTKEKVLLHQSECTKKHQNFKISDWTPDWAQLKVVQMHQLLHKCFGDKMPDAMAEPKAVPAVPVVARTEPPVLWEQTHEPPAKFTKTIAPAPPNTSQFCNLCSAHVGPDASAQREHVVGKHLQEGVYACTACSYRAPSAADIRLHISRLFCHFRRIGQPCVEVKSVTHGHCGPNVQVEDRSPALEHLIKQKIEKCFGKGIEGPRVEDPTPMKEYNVPGAYFQFPGQAKPAAPPAWNPPPPQRPTPQPPPQQAHTRAPRPQVPIPPPARRPQIPTPPPARRPQVPTPPPAVVSSAPVFNPPTQPPASAPASSSSSSNILQCSNCRQKVHKQRQLDHIVDRHVSFDLVLCPLCPLSIRWGVLEMERHMRDIHAEEMTADPDITPIRRDGNILFNLHRECFPGQVFPDPDKPQQIELSPAVPSPAAGPISAVPSPASSLASLKTEPEEGLELCLPASSSTASILSSSGDQPGPSQAPPQAMHAISLMMECEDTGRRPQPPAHPPPPPPNPVQPQTFAQPPAQPPAVNPGQPQSFAQPPYERPPPPSQPRVQNSAQTPYSCPPSQPQAPPAQQYPSLAYSLSNTHPPVLPHPHNSNPHAQGGGSQQQPPGPQFMQRGQRTYLRFVPNQPSPAPMHDSSQRHLHSHQRGQISLKSPRRNEAKY